MTLIYKKNNYIKLHKKSTLKLFTRYLRTRLIVYGRVCTTRCLRQVKSYVIILSRICLDCYRYKAPSSTKNYFQNRCNYLEFIFPDETRDYFIFTENIIVVEYFSL